ncbi:DUF6223 family protein [Nocardia ignorata]|uniref:Tryptophan-associated transmembrane protein n=1 Tax=Nocardia ignorata TaxID=145285 RepID=A0A4R6PK45_NOCIG|nr:DUF6223 family protein [Nocardia ignorata]TDP38778.1 hypothetical protein DFR75_103436 [Nocardia ignorata]
MPTSIRTLTALAVTAPLAVGTAAPASAATALAASYGMSSGRLVASSAAVIGLLGVLAGGWALARPAATRAVFALVAGLIAIVGGAWVVATAEGGLGTGNGLGGGVVAIVFGLASVVVGGLSLARSRRVG